MTAEEIEEAQHLAELHRREFGPHGLVPLLLHVPPHIAAAVARATEIDDDFVLRALNAQFGFEANLEHISDQYEQRRREEEGCLQFMESLPRPPLLIEDLTTGEKYYERSR